MIIINTSYQIVFSEFKFTDNVPYIVRIKDDNVKNSENRSLNISLINISITLGIIHINSGHPKKEIELKISKFIVY